MHLLDRIDQWGRRTPDRVAHTSGGSSLSWGQLLCRSDALANILARALPSDGSPVAVVGHKEPEMLIAFLGCVKSGHPYVPLDVSLPDQRRERILAAANAARVLTPQDVAALCPPDAVPVQPPPADLRISGEQAHYIIFTSGSTGDSKGVIITSACLEAFVEWTLGEQKPAESAEVFLNQAPFSFDLSVMELYTSLVTGGTLYSITREQIGNPRLLFNGLNGAPISFWVSTPSFAQMCLTERTFAQPMLPALRKFWFCGETLPPDVAAALLDRFPSAQVWNAYGPTEATVATTSIQITRQLLARHSPLPVGYAMPGARLYCAADNGAEMADGQKGELVIVGTNVSPGYFGQPELTARSFFQRDGLRAYNTGDWGRILDGLVFFDGRIDGQVKLHGYRIELGDIEANLRALPGVRDAVVLPVNKGGTLDSLAAVVVPAQRSVDELAAISAIKSQLGARVPAYMVPRKFIFIDVLPMTPNGKADRRKLAELLT